MTVRLALAQLNPRVGDLDGNARLVVGAVHAARDAGADLLVLPELVLTGYPPEDLLLKGDFVRAAMRHVDVLAREAPDLAVVLGTVYHDHHLHNSAVLLYGGGVAAVHHKQFLPNYGVFDERRYFAPGVDTPVCALGDLTFGVGVCEDVWYPDGPHYHQSLAGAQLILNLSASPYDRGKGARRRRMLATRAADARAYLAYCNMVGGQDELVFDGHSVVCDPAGEVVAAGRQFAPDFLVVDLELDRVRRERLREPRPVSPEVRARVANAVKPVELGPRADRAGRPASVPRRVDLEMDDVAEVYAALVLGTRDYVEKNGFPGVVLGLSGGIDSSLVAAVAADALGAEHVTGVAMPTRYSSPHSLEDARALAANFGVRFEELPIDRVFQAFLDALDPLFAGRAADVTEENLQSRIRGTSLMALSNKFNWLVLTTGNKSEVSVGYSTLYGDSAGGFAVIKDVPKTLVYALCRYRNAVAGRDVIPDRVLTKAPSAELRPDQKDSDSLPDYSTLDAILEAYVERNLGVSTIADGGFEPAVVRRTTRLVDRSEYKRRQSPPGVKISPRAFGRDWRLPISNGYSSPA